MDRAECRTVIDAAFRKADEIGWIINQSAAELSFAGEAISHVRPHIVLEIGCQHGGWMYAIHPMCGTRPLYIAVDPAFSTGWPIYSKLLADSGVDVREIRGTSQASYMLIVAALAGRPVDVLHIDGDHHVSAVLCDFAAYSPFVRPGGLVLMHDVCGSQGPGTALGEILHSERANRIAESQIVCDTWQRQPNARMGIAILRMR